MKIKTITCHDVYNVGASLQAYALQHYLTECGHDVEIIDYKPDYLSGHYNFFLVNTPKYDKLILRELYILAHFPRRLISFFNGKKQRFDRFKDDYLKTTKIKYHSCVELRRRLPDADCFIAGSDQIWNPHLQNGSDPSFYLQFAPDDSRKISYAASFATEALPAERKQMIKPWLQGLDAISVREQSGVKILSEMGLSGKAVCDPVFLLNKDEWINLAVHRLYKKPYIIIYDFDGNETMQKIAINIAESINAEVISIFPVKNKRIRTFRAVGPREFLSLVLHAEAVVSNSFHAAAFSLIFHKELFVLKRSENLNARMIDLLGDVGLQERLVHNWNDCVKAPAIDWNKVDCALGKKILDSEKYLSAAIEGV